MSKTEAKPRRRRVPGDKNSNIYERPDGLFEVGFRDSSSKQRWRVPGFPPSFENITEARRARDSVIGKKADGQIVKPSPGLTFGAAADKWLAEQVVELRPQTRASYSNSVNRHLRPRWGKKRLDHIDVNDAAKLVRELRAEGKAETTIATVLRAASRVFKFAHRRMGWNGVSPLTLLERGERPRISETATRRIYTEGELADVITVSSEPWTTLFRFASVVAGRESELLGLRWEDLRLDDMDAALVRFTHQVDRSGERVELKTAESKATLPLPRSVALMLLEHRARSSRPGPESYVFATATGRPISQRNVLRALYRAQEQARRPDGTPTFPELFEHDDRGHLVVDAKVRFVRRKAKRSELAPLPHFHSLRHGAAMDCDDAEEASDLLRHKNSNVTRAVYRAHFSDRRREALRPGMEARMEATDRSESRNSSLQDAKVTELSEIRSRVL